MGTCGPFLCSAANASLTSCGALEMEQGPSHWVTEERASGECGHGCEGGGVKQQVNTCSRQAPKSHW